MTSADAPSSQSKRPDLTGRLLLVGLAALILMALVLMSLSIGARPVPLEAVVQALLAPDLSDPEHLVVRELRLTRTLNGLVVGAALAVAGLMIQTVTQNGLADPGLLGINAGAAFAVVVSIWAFGLSGGFALGWVALLGAGATTLLVLTVARLSGGSRDPLNLILAGAAATAVLSAITSVLLLHAQEALNTFRFWVIGSLAVGGSAQAGHLLGLSPFLIAGGAATLAASRGLNSLMLGEEIAQSLGISPDRVRGLALLACVLLASAATAAVGPIGFLGLVVPHMVRAVTGPNIGWALAGSALMGPSVLLAADILGRVVLESGEVQAGIMMAGLGGLAFVAVVRAMKVLSL